MNSPNLFNCGPRPAPHPRIKGKKRGQGHDLSIIKSLKAQTKNGFGCHPKPPGPKHNRDFQLNFRFRWEEGVQACAKQELARVKAEEEWGNHFPYRSPY